jgi:hypothetical protein
VLLHAHERQTISRDEEGDVRIRLLLVVLSVGIAGLGLAGSADGVTRDGRVATPTLLVPDRDSVTNRESPTQSGSVSISGTVLDYDGTPLVGASVDWGWYAPNAPAWFGPDVVYHAGEYTDTATGGTFSFSDVTSVPGSDTLTASYDSATGGFTLSSWANDFSTQPSYVLRPGRVPITITNLPPGSSPQVTVGDVATGSATSQPRLIDGHGLASTVAPGFRTAVVEREATWGVHAALDWTSPGGALVPVTSGTTSGEEIILDWSQARHGRLAGTRWQHAARPGDLVTFVLKDWPAGYQASFYGTSWGDEGVVRWYDTSVTSTGADQTYRVSLRVPRNLPMDDLYLFGAYRSDAPATLLWFNDFVQPCRFGATQAVIQRGQAVQLRGRVLGDSRRVDLFERRSAAGPPSGPAARGWTKVATLYAGKDGRFHSGWRRPSRTTWYVARIRGYYFPAYTPVVKVTVR